MHVGKTLVLVDGSSLAFRSFFALFTTGLRSRSGVPTWAVLGFFNSLFELIEKYTPDMLAVCFDTAAKTHRETEYEDYKANREEMPDDLSAQWPLLKQGVAALGLPVYELDGWEADDVIGTLVRLAEAQGIKVLILTGDQDAFQLLDGEGHQVKVLMPGKNGLQLYGRQEVFDKLGVWPEQVTDYKGLCGDSSDNIPGIRGVGPKTAVQLLSSYKDIEGIYKHASEITSKSLKQKIIDGEAIARASKKLATIREDVPLTFDFEHCLLTPPNIEEVSEFFRSLDFKTIITRLPKVFKHFQQTATAPITASAVQSIDLALPEPPKSKTEFTKADTDQEFDLRADFPLFIVDTQQKLTELLNKLSKQSVIALAIETDSEHPLNCEITGYALAWSDDLRIERFRESNHHGLGDLSDIGTAYIPMGNQTSLYQEQLNPELVNEKLKPLLADKKIGKVGYNSKTMQNSLSLKGIVLESIVFDPMLAGYVVFPDEKQDLVAQAERLLNYYPAYLNSQSTSGRKSASSQKLPASEIPRYLSDQARLTHILTQWYLQKIEKDQIFLLNEMELPLSSVLARMEQAGVALDLKYLDLFSKELSTDIQRLEGEIYGFAKHPFNINSTQQLQKVLFEELSLKPKGKTKTGYSTDASVLEALKEDHPIISNLLNYRQLTKLRSTYVDALPKLISPRDSRLHGEFNQTATSTGRLSSSNPNLQNIPIRNELGQRMRRAFVPGNPKSLLLSADYSQIELRILAHMCEDETLIDAFIKNQDIHARTASEIFEKSIDDVTSDMRRVGKTLNYALLYQQGAYATSQALSVSTKEAAAFIDKYFKRYARVRMFLDEIIRNARETGYVETIWKRRRYFKYLNDRNDPLRKADERAACNAPLQGSAADLMKLAMVRLDDQLTARNLSSRLILQVHDELVLEVPQNEVEEMKEVVTEAMLLEQPFKVPLTVDVGVGKNWMDLQL